uniref:Uncharacterized protein LOC104242198 n=1 Tax=Nicotiana sylvestris TaxID=4096 RepID=A0A1U7Y0T9_NICSY|nr:PREDICTED: uncharacterized protein LOC104242198 [Nicotiana sylvestris]
MVFSKRFIGLIFGIVSNNWYSVLVNGQLHGFFMSSREVKQGDRLSPTLFILAVEKMSRGLNALHQNLYFCGFGFPKWSPKINLLAYADDTIIFSSSDATSLRLIMEVLNAYEAALGQLINKSKSAIYVHHSTSDEVLRKIEGITGIGRNDFPFIYLGCPIFYSMRRMDYYEGLITKVLDKLQTWKGKLLSIGGRAVLISSVLQSMPTHLLSVVNPPANVINKLHKLFARFFWSSSVEGKARHWASWDTLCLPKEEWGVGFRSLHDMSKALFCKLWWNFRTKPSLWSSFISQKYCKKLNDTVVPWKYGSHVWRKMLECLGALYFVTPPDFIVDESIQNVNEVTVEGQWDEGKLRQLLPEDLTLHMLESIASSRVWSYLFSYAGLSLEGLSLHQAIVKCWTWQSLIKARKPGITSVPFRWPDMLKMMEDYTPNLKFNKVLWEFQIPGWTKINTDGASRGNPGRSSIGYCLRNEHGDMIFGCGKEIQETTNTQAEIKAILEALQYSRTVGIFNVWVQIDSMLLKRVIEGIWKPPWVIDKEAKEIRQLLTTMNGMISHIYQEVNKVADHLTNYALDQGNTQCHSFYQLDTQGMRLINGDKMQCPYLRVKVSRQ